VKDLQTRSVIARCNSTGDLYPFFTPPSTIALTAAASSTTLWHRRLGHISYEALSTLISSNAIPCNKCHDTHICHACQLGRHVRLPFSISNSRASHAFDLIHCDLWTSPVVSVSGYKYYLVILYDCTHYTWTFFTSQIRHVWYPHSLFFLCAYAVRLLHQGSPVRQRS
jgi:hypothetical protein